jgi:hypothetical protein
MEIKSFITLDPDLFKLFVKKLACFLVCLGCNNKDKKALFFMKMTSRAIVMKLISLYFTNFHNKLECLPQVSFSCLV